MAAYSALSFKCSSDESPATPKIVKISYKRQAGGFHSRRFALFYMLDHIRICTGIRCPATR